MFTIAPFAYAWPMRPAPTLPLFHLYGDPPDDQAFDFIHIETIASRSSLHDWTIQAHCHRNLFQILAIGHGAGEMVHEAAVRPFTAPVAIVVAPTVAHGFRFQAHVTAGWVISFSEDVAQTLGEGSGAALHRLKVLAADPIVALNRVDDGARLLSLCRDLDDERFLARDGYRLALHALLALIAIEVGRLAASRSKSGLCALAAADNTVEALRRLIEANFRCQRQLSFYARQLAMTSDRLNDHVKRAIGVTAGHLIRQRVVTQAKRQLVFSDQSIHEIAYDLAFTDPSHFTRFFRRNTGTSPQAFREARQHPRPPASAMGR